MTRIILLLVLGLMVGTHALATDFDQLKSRYKSTSAGGIGSGGAAAVGDELLDFYENNGSERLTPEMLKAEPAYIEMRKRVELAKEMLPQFDQLLNWALSKRWYLEEKPLSEADCVNYNIFKIETQIVACQSKSEVRISKSWFRSKAKPPMTYEVWLKNRAGALLHELLVANYWNTFNKSNRADAEASIRRINRHVFGVDLLNETELIGEVYIATGFNLLSRDSYDSRISEAKQILVKTLRIFCEAEAGSMDQRSEDKEGEEYYQSNTKFLYSEVFSRDGASSANARLFENGDDYIWSEATYAVKLKVFLLKLELTQQQKQSIRNYLSMVERLTGASCPTK